MTPIPSSGPTNAKLAIVGDAPNQYEELSGQPFTGASGRLLTDMLASCGISRDQCYLTNVVKIKPPNGSFDFFYDGDSRRNPPSSFLQESIDGLKHELSSVNPNAILALGPEALRAITGHQGIDKWRGSILSSPSGKVVATHAPSYVLRSYHERVVVELDIKRAIQQSTFPQYLGRKYDFIYNPTVQNVIDALYEYR